MPAHSTSEGPAVARLATEGVTVSFGATTALDDVAIAVAPKQVIGVIGTNGAGKTTLLDVICGVTEADGGRVLLDGEPLHADPRRLDRSGIARTQQRPELPGDQTVVEYTLGGADAPAPRTGIGALWRALPRGRRADPIGPGSREADGEFNAHAVQLLRELGLASSAASPIDTLSHADRARLAIARATILPPHLLLLDEPGGGLGPEERRELAALIRSYATRPGRDCSVIVVDHHFDLIAAACDTVVVLDAGRVIARGTPDEIRRDEATLAAYLGHA
ncbi:MAG: ATP-binding cassette domain-containing protein [Solirubrobacteraceae bacterium]|nr:ATP-binding cassette domain-containing protein [Solirubrobacteraceae bacterium]